MLFTIGYEKASIEHFIGTVQEMGIDIVIDIRERPQSRKKGFSKRPLSEALNAHGVDYLHMKALGDPKEGRDAARSGRFEEFKQVYLKVLDSEDAMMAIDKIVYLMKSRSVCLLCYERHHKDCHRSLVVDRMLDRISEKPKHIGVRPIEPIGSMCDRR